MYLRVLTGLILFVLSIPAKAQWQRLPGPMPDFGGLAGAVTCIATNDTFVWIGTETAGVFRNTAGLTFNDWQPKNDGMPSYTIFSLTWANGLLVATTQRGVYKSADGGNNWTAINNGLPIGRTISAFSATGGAMLAATADYGVFRSTDNGQSWQSANNGLLDNFILDLKTDGQNFWALTKNAGLFKSGDLGQSWQQVNTQACVECLRIEIVGNTIFLAGGNVWTSRDTGKGWTADTLKNITGISAYKGRLMAHSAYRVYESTDTGKTWVLDWEFNLDSARQVNAVLATPADIKYIATKKHGLYRGTIAAITWKPYNMGLLTANIIQLEWYENVLLAVAYGKLLRSTDKGITWANIGPPTAVVNNFITTTQTTKRIYTATDSGVWGADYPALNWQPAQNNITTKKVYRLLKRGTAFYAIAANGLYYTPNTTAVQWFLKANPIDTLVFTDIWFDSNILYAGTNAGIYSSTNDGQSFTIVNPSQIPRRYVYLIRRINGKLWLEIGIDTHLSTDGNDWPRHYYIGGTTFANSLSLVGNRMYASTTNGFMFKDTAAEQWNFIKNIPGVVANVFEQNDSFLYAGTGAGLWRLPLTSVVTAVNSSENNFKFYPNPAVGNINIESEDEIKVIRLFSLTGQEITDCIGCQSLALQNIPQGIYIIRAEGNMGIYTGKVVVGE